QEFLRKTLIGNILSMSKSFNYQVPDTIKCDVQVNIRKNRLKETNMMSFVGVFSTNFLIPDYLGIGKSVSRGFGAVRQLGDHNKCSL
ncbi:MAG: CRISPR-associated endonuclease Cas6, partial [Candidatus Methanoperedens sp.]